jgi:peptidoglycan hydrolase-like protein with peptidoglycan-binding domain
MVGQKRFDAKNVAQKTGRDGGNMCFWRYALVLAFSLAVAPMGQAQEATEEQAWIQIESYPSEATARARAEAYAAEFPDVTVFKGRSWHAIVLGPYSPEAAAGRLAELRRSGQVPGDAFVTDGGGFTGVLEDLAVAEAMEREAIATEAPVAETVAPAAVEAETMAPESIEPAPLVIEPDETLREARASEAELSRDERMTLQEALKWYGFYASGIDGAFGQGTRASMSAWQEANGFEPTGVLTTRQRATLVTNHAADLAEFGFESVTEAEAGIEITLPLSLVTFDHYEPPFVHFAEKDGSGLRVLLISEPGGPEALAGLYDILQTLEAVPETGERSLGDTSFTIQAASSKLESLAFAETRDGMVKGYLAVWNPADAARMERILPVLQSSFRAVGGKALDPGLVPMEEAALSGMLSGLELRKPARVASGVFVDEIGHVATALANVAGCAKVTIGAETAADVAAEDAATGLALLTPKAALAPRAVARLATASPRSGAEISVAGFSYGERLPAAVLTFGTFEAAEGIMGEPGQARLLAPVMAGDMGGPVLDSAGGVLGVLIPVPADAGRQLPEGMALAADAASLGALVQGAGLVMTAGPAASGTPATPDALNAAALGMTVQVSCWAE